MAITLNTNFGIAAPNPADNRYLSNRLSGGKQLPYSGISEVLSTIPESRRYPGLTVLIDSGSTAVEYWFREGINNSDLIPKTVDISIPSGNFITGATNIGYFSGYTGIQTLVIDNLLSNNYDGEYHSLYNYYYRDCNGVIRTGAPQGCALRRGYYNPVKNKSWIWNDREYGTQSIGWIFVDGNVENLLGSSPSVASYYPPGGPYTAVTWTTSCNNGSNTVINTPIGSLLTGSTLIIGARSFACSDYNKLHFRTIVSDTPNVLSVKDDESFVRLSGKTSILRANNIGIGSKVFSGQTNTDLYFKTLIGSGDTILSTTANEIIIYTNASGQASVTGGTNIGFSGGTGVFAGKNNKTMLFRNIIGSGDTTVSLSGNTIIVHNDINNNTYNLTSPAAITVGGICAGTPLTGKTAFQLFEELLVPELFPTLINPSTTTVLYSGSTAFSNNSLWEIGCNIGIISVCSLFDKGSITPQYCSASAYRSGDANCYVFIGTDVAGSYACTSTSMSRNTSSYTILPGNNTWGTSTCYNAGVQPKSNKGNNYCSPLPSGQTSLSTATLVGVYPIFATTVNISALTKQQLYNMSTANNILINLIAETNGYKQKFEIPCVWLSSRPLYGVCQWNNVSNSWEYPGGSATSSLNLWTPSSATETVQNNSIGYCRYTFNGVCRGSTCIRLVF